jgi:hypothetical protein
MTSTEFLDECYRQASNEQAASVFVMCEIDKMLRNGRFDCVNEVLACVDLSRLSPRVVLAISTITRGCYVELPILRAFLERLRDYLTSEVGEDRAKLLVPE